MPSMERSRFFATQPTLVQKRSTLGLYGHLTRLPPHGFEAVRAKAVELGIAANARTDEARKHAVATRTEFSVGTARPFTGGCLG